LLTQYLSDWNLIIEELQTLDITPVFDSKEGAIKLRGTCSSHRDKGKKLLGELTDSTKAKTATNIHIAKMDSPRLMATYHQHTSTRPRPGIHALDVKENEDVLALWNKYLLPSYSSMVRNASIEGSHSVSLVLQDVLDSLHPVIRFRSSGEQSEQPRQIVREGMKMICLENHSPKLHVQFTVGTLVRLVGVT
jgi:hypothetical protein